MLENQNELKARIEHEKRNLMFYSLHWDALEKVIPPREFEKMIDLHLDRLSILLKLKG